MYAKTIVANNPAYTQIYHNVASGAIASWDVQGIPQIYNHLVIEMAVRGDTGAKSTSLWCRFNNMSGASNYVNAAGLDTKIILGTFAASTTSDTSAYGMYTLQIPSYVHAVRHSIHGTYAGRVNDGGTSADFSGGYVGGTIIATSSEVAIDRLTFLPAAGNFVAGSRLSIYGVL